VLQRPPRPPPSPAASRARRWRAQRRAGLRQARLAVPERRLRRAMLVAREHAGQSVDLDTWGDVEAELMTVVDAFIERWLGPAKNRTRDG
jgi:hypothetical protein